MTIQEDWDRMAAAYEVFHTGEDSYSRRIEWPCIRELLPELKDRSILDVGCGTGIFTFQLEEYAPKRLVGLDLSSEMLAIARQKAAERHSGAEFLLGDAAFIRESTEETFDFVFSSTTSHYIEDLNAFFQGIAASLTEDGCCVLSVIHPVYSAMYPVRQGGDAFPEEEAWQVRYLDRSLRAYVQPWLEYNDRYENHLSTSYHHTFGDYIRSALQVGLSLCDVREPMPPESWKKDCPGRYESFVETPTYLVLKFVKRRKNEYGV